LPERPFLRLLLLALMGLALASRLALGATLPAANAGDRATGAGALATLQAAMIMCHIGNGHTPAPKIPQGPLLSDLLLFDQADNAHALASSPTAALRLALDWSAAEFMGVHATPRPPLRRTTRPARGPPIIG
jgi:hypothetical protein